MKNGHWQGILFLSTVAPVIEEESRDLLNMVDVLLSPGDSHHQEDDKDHGNQCVVDLRQDLPNQV